MIFYIYKITNMINNKTYIGRSNHSSLKRDKNYYGSGPYIKRAIMKYGKENFRKDIIIDRVYDRNRIIEIEENIIALYKRHGKAEYNLITKGYGNSIEYLNFKNRHHTEEFKKHMSQILTGRKHEKHDDLWKKHMSSIMKQKSIFVTNNPSVKGSKVYNDGVKNIIIKPGEEVPDGLQKGSIYTGRIPWNKGMKKEKQKIIKEKTKRSSWCKGLTKETDDRIAKLAIKGRETKILNKSACGEKNSNAKKYLAIDSHGEEYIIFGCLKNFCNEHSLSYSLVCNKIDCGVIEKTMYINYSNIKYSKTLNSIGWEFKFLGYCNRKGKKNEVNEIKC